MKWKLGQGEWRRSAMTDEAVARNISGSKEGLVIECDSEARDSLALSRLKDKKEYPTDGHGYITVVESHGIPLRVVQEA